MKHSIGQISRARIKKKLPTCAAQALLASVVFAAACSGEDPAASGTAEAPLLRPTAGDVITIGTRATIQWTPSPEAKDVDVKLSFPDGTTQVIAQKIPNEGMYTWDVPLIYNEDDTRSYSISVSPAGQDEQGSIDNHPPTLGVANSLTMGSVAGFKWNGATEDYYWIDLVTGQSQILGSVGDMKIWEWKGGAAFDARSGLIYVIASSGDAQYLWKIYTLDAATGALVADVAIQGKNPSSIKVNSNGEVLGFSWNGSKEELSAVDPATGAVTQLGTVGNFSLWSNESAIDNQNNRLYVLAIDDPNFVSGSSPDPNAPWSVYTLDSLTGALLSTKPLSPPDGGISGLAVTRVGALVGFHWNGSQEELVEVDPATGAVSTLGTVGDLTSWSGYTAINLTTDDIYVFGFDPNKNKKLYTMNAQSGALLYDMAIVDYPSSTLLVY